MRRNSESSVLIALGFTLHFAVLIACSLLYKVNSLRLRIFPEISVGITAIVDHKPYDQLNRVAN